jgi:hypothetical protein
MQRVKSLSLEFGRTFTPIVEGSKSRMGFMPNSHN